MTKDVRDILRAARALPPHEQLEILQGLVQSLAQAYSPLAAGSAAFWAPRSLEYIANERGVPAVSDVRALAMPDWPADETADDVIYFTREQRDADRGS